MLEKLNNLRFLIGAFFTIIACVLFINILFNDQNDKLSLYAAASFIIFGLLMMFDRRRKKD